MKKILSTIFSLTLILFSIVLFSGCFGGSDDYTPHTHTYKSNYSYNETHHWIEPTCSCGKNKNSSRHLFGGDHICSVCGYERDPSSLIQYEFSSNRNIYYITGYNGATINNLVIPDEYNGYPVTNIDVGAFKGKDVRTITFGKNITTIGRFAFADNENLISVSFPNNIQTLMENVFENCTSLKDINFGSISKIEEMAFKGCTSIEEVTLPSTLKNIDCDAFVGCTNLKKATFTGTQAVINGFEGCTGIEEVIIPDGCTGIGYWAFKDTPNLKRLVLPSTIKSINWNAFNNTNSEVEIVYKGTLNDYAKIHFEDEVSSPTNTGGKLIINNQLVTKIDTSVTEISDYAFYNYKYLEELDLSSEITAIGKLAFYNCDNLSTISIPASLTTIGDNAFDNLDNLEQFIVDENNTKFSSIDGCLLSKDGSIFYQYPLGRESTEIVVPSSVIEFKKNSFAGAKLTSLTVPFVGKGLNGEYANFLGYMFGATTYEENIDYVPSTLKTICVNGATVLKSNCFYGLTNVTNFTLTNIEGIENSAFNSCGENVKTLILPNTIKLEKLSTTFLDGLEGLEELTVHALDRRSYYYPASMKKLTLLTGDIVYREMFGGGTHLESVILPTNLQQIYWDCFKNYTNLKEINIPSSVYTIGSNAFENCTSLTSITIPAGVSVISSNIFKNCSNLESTKFLGAIIEVGGNAFYRCEKLTDLGIEDTTQIDFIGSRAFYCTDISEFSVSPNLDYMGECAFDGCAYLKKLTIPFLGESLEIANDDSDSLLTDFDTSDYVPNRVEELTILAGGIRTEAFSFNPTNLKKLTLGKDISFIKYDAFKDFTNLEELAIEDIEDISFDGDCFDGCISLNKVSITNLEKFLNIKFITEKSNPLYYAKNLYINGTFANDIIIPSSITSLNSYSLINCSAENITLSTNMLSIGVSALKNCANLKYKKYGGLNYLSATDGENITEYYAVIMPEENAEHLEFNVSTKVIATNAFYNSNYVENRKRYSYIDIGSELTWCTIDFGSVKTYLSNGVDNHNNPFVLGTVAYKNGSEMKEFVVPSGYNITRINNYTFYEMNTIEKIVVPEGVTTIGEKAFYEARSLSELSLPSTLTSIEYYAFGGYNSLEKVNIVSQQDWLDIEFKSIDSNPFTTTRKECGLYINNEKLTEFEVTYQTQSINNYQFANMTTLTKIIIPSGVITYKTKCFAGTNLDVYITDISKWALLNRFFDGESNPINGSGNLYVNGELLTHLDIDSDVYSEIVSYAFYNCTCLQKVTIGDGITLVNQYAFYNCSNIKGEYSFEATSITCFGKYALYGCEGLLEDDLSVRKYNLHLRSALPGIEGDWERYDAENREREYYRFAFDTGQNFAYFMIIQYASNTWTFK